MKIFNTVIVMATALTITLITTASAQVVWLENFDGQEGYGITGGTPPTTNMPGITKWSVATTTSLESNQNAFVNSLVFEINNVQSQVVWQTEEIDISANAFVNLSVDLSEVGAMVSANYIRTYYSVNGQSNTLFFENGDLVADFTEAVARQEAVTGTNLVITIKASNNTATKKHRFDNITVTDHNPDKKIIWLENFDDFNGKGAYGPSNTVDLAGVTNWTVNITNTDLTASTDYFKVKDKRFEARDLDGEAVWISTNIDISTYASVSVEVDIDYAGGAEEDDYIRTYYSINGGTETLFEQNGDLTNDFIQPVIAKQGGLSGSTLSIIIRCKNDVDAEKYYFDHITVSTPIPSGLIMIVR